MSVSFYIYILGCLCALAGMLFGSVLGVYAFALFLSLLRGPLVPSLFVIISTLSFVPATWLPGYALALCTLVCIAGISLLRSSFSFT